MQQQMTFFATQNRQQTRPDAAEFFGGSLGAHSSIPEHQAANPASYTNTDSEIVVGGQFAVDLGQQMIDQVVGECLTHEEWHEPEVESEIPPGLDGVVPIGTQTYQYHIGTPQAPSAAPMEHDLILPRSPSTERVHARHGVAEVPEHRPLKTGVSRGRGMISHGSNLNPCSWIRLLGPLNGIP